MTHKPNPISQGLKLYTQRGAVLFFALIALVVMTLAAVALIRSVDTNTLIAGNLAFKRSATSSGDAGTEAAIVWLQANLGALDTSNAGAGYYNSLNQDLDLMKQNWSTIGVSAGQDNAGNTVRYVIQRLCNHPPAQAASVNSGATIAVSETTCILSDATPPNNEMAVLDATQVCNGPGCATTVGKPIYRVTAQVTGPRNTVSYVQAFVF